MVVLIFYIYFPLIRYMFYHSAVDKKKSLDKKSKLTHKTEKHRKNNHFERRSK